MADGTKTGAEGAPVVKHGGSDAIHDAKTTNVPIGESPKDPANE